MLRSAPPVTLKHLWPVRTPEFETVAKVRSGWLLQQQQKLRGGKPAETERRSNWLPVSIYPTMARSLTEAG